MDPVRFCLSDPSFRLVFEYDPYGTPPLRMAPFKIFCAVCPEKLQPLSCRDHGLRYTFGQVCILREKRDKTEILASYTKVLQNCTKRVPKVPEKCPKSVRKVFQKCSKSAPKLYQKGSRVYRKCHQGASEVSPGCIGRCRKCSKSSINFTFSCITLNFLTKPRRALGPIPIPTQSGSVVPMEPSPGLALACVVVIWDLYWFCMKFIRIEQNSVELSRIQQNSVQPVECD